MDERTWIDAVERAASAVMAQLRLTAPAPGPTACLELIAHPLSGPSAAFPTPPTFLPHEPARPAPPPSRHDVAQLVELSRRVVFPGFFEDHPLSHDARETCEQRLAVLVRRTCAHALQVIETTLAFTRSRRHSADPAPTSETEPVPAAARRLAAAFAARFPAIREMLALDAAAAFDGDPAAQHPDEVVLCHPGLDAIFAHRLAHELWTLDARLLARMIAEQAHARTGIDIHPGASIGRSFFIDHGAGTVIGETSRIGEGVRIYQGVTLGARSLERDSRGRVHRDPKRHPTIGDRVTIYANAVVLGGDTTIGDDCVISGGVFLTESVPPGHVVKAKPPELILRERQ